MSSTPPRSIDALVDSLTLEEQISLLAGTDFWHTAAIDRVGIPAMRVTDGPVGARGTQFQGGPVSLAVPCSTALAASFDPALVEEIGALLGREARAKGARVLLAPTVNLHRTPIGGRNFECMSEDPYLTAEIAVGYVRGLQSEGVASCIKHLVGNDTEFERNTINSIIDERTLRELYLVPFEAAVKQAGVQAVMTAYNRLNGPFSADSVELIDGILRGEWGFDGLVMSDWFGLHSTAEGIVAGVDLEMPGPTKHRGEQLLDAVVRGEVRPEAVRERARTVLAFLDRIGALDDGGPGPESASPAHQEDRDLIRRAAAAGMVLLRNEDGALPLAPHAGSKMAVIGPNAAIGGLLGGGSAVVTPTAVSHPLAALRSRLGAAGGEVTYAIGCTTYKQLPLLSQTSGPVRVEFFNDPAAVDAAAQADLVTGSPTSKFMWFSDPFDRAPGSAFGARITADIVPEGDGEWTFSVTSMNDALIYVDGELVVDNRASARGASFFGFGRAEAVGTVRLVGGTTHHVEVRVHRPESAQVMTGLLIGAAPVLSGDPIAAAEAAAADADVSVVIVGTNDDWESEGFDRDSMDLPGRQDELISRVAAVSRRTIVVVNAGSPVTMPWIDEVEAVLVCWFPGQEMGDALCDVLFGDVEPGGRLPTTFPRRLEDSPAFEHHPGRNGEAHYLERRLIGYRWYDTVGREPLFPFGHGLGYTRHELARAEVLDPWRVEVEVASSSGRPGGAVVQVYAAPVDTAGVADEPAQRLVGFARVAVRAGGSSVAEIRLDPRAYQGWNTGAHDWVDSGGAFELRLGWSSRDIVIRSIISGEARHA